MVIHQYVFYQLMVVNVSNNVAKINDEGRLSICQRIDKLGVHGIT